MRAVVLAGGLGTRLKPYTTTIPKPLVPIGGEMPILEIVIRQLANHGFDHVTLAVNHLANLIMAFFEDGARWGLRIDYSLEESPLSTIGPLTLIDDLPDDFLVMNGDILTDLDYSAFFAAHRASGRDATIAVSSREVRIDYGVIEHEDGTIRSFTEKPSIDYDVSMGIYCFNRRAIAGLERGQPYGFDNLMIDRLAAGLPTGVHPYPGFWLDIGRGSDYDYANEHFEELRAKLGV